MIRKPAVIFCPLIVLLVVGDPALAEREFRPIDSSQQYRLTKGETTGLEAMLRKMGLSLADEHKVDPADGIPVPVPFVPVPGPQPAPGPAPQPAPGPAPQPAPEPTPPPAPAEKEDDFFDDDFFDDDRGFDDIVADMDKEFEEAVAKWDKEFEETLKRWEQGNKEYQQHKDAYLASTIAFESDGAAVQFGNSAAAHIAAMRPGDFHVIPNALSLEVRAQKYRGTCTAFAGVRALEILVGQHGIASDLSEHNFYFRSKPECQNYPCNESKEGGTLDKGLRIISREGVMAESNCRYIPKLDANNITYSNAGQTVSPPNTCAGQSVARSGSLTRLGTIDQILNSLRNNRPVVAGVMLRKDDSFFNSSGLVERYHPKNVAARGRTAGGHAITLVGYIKLPPSMSREGSYCVITTNSWDWHWGSGGHACITEAWLKQNIHVAAYAVNSAVLTDQGLTAFSR